MEWLKKLLGMGNKNDSNQGQPQGDMNQPQQPSGDAGTPPTGDMNQPQG